MALIQYAAPWDRQPQGAVSAIGRVSYLLNCATLIDCVTGLPAAKVNAPPAGRTKYGVGPVLDGSSQSINTGQKFVSASGTLIHLTVESEIKSGSYTIAGQVDSDAGGGIGLGWSSNTFNAGYGQATGLPLKSGDLWLAGTWHPIDGIKAYVDGVEVSTGAYNGPTVAAPGNYFFEIGAFSYNGGRIFRQRGTPLLLLYLPYALSGKEIAALYDPQWSELWRRFVEPQTIWVPMATAAIGGNKVRYYYDMIGRPNV